MGLALLIQILSASVRPGSTSVYSPTGHVNITRPLLSQKDDLLFLFLSRTDDALPISLNDGWLTAASCLKKKNSVKECLTVEECDMFKSKNYCYGGADLGTVVFYKKMAEYEPAFYSLNMKAYFLAKPAWAILAVSFALPSAQTFLSFFLKLKCYFPNIPICIILQKAVHNADITTGNPIRSVAATSCDMVDASEFPSVYGKTDDVLLLSMAFDDYAPEQDFQAPNGTQLESYISGPDETGFLYSEELVRAGEAGIRTTRGLGGYRCKDALISLVVKRRSTNTTLKDLLDP